MEQMQIDINAEDNDNIQQQPIVVNNTNIDLETYANSFEGLARIHRLMYIADVCPSLRLEAIKMAIQSVMETYNTTLYLALHQKLTSFINGTIDANSGAGNNVLADLVPDIAMQANFAPDLPVYDANWAEMRAKKGALELEKLNHDLNNYKSNSIKESIRRGYDDLGDHYLNSGEMSNALKCYSKSRDYCTSGKHVISMCLNVIKVSIHLQSWSYVLNYVSKAETTPDIATNTKDGLPVVTVLKCSAGLALLSTKRYKAAAKNFVASVLDHCDFPDIMSANNVALYGGICALATFDRQELQKYVISSSSFKLFLELEPQLRDVIQNFYDSKYASCLKLLYDMRENLLIDMYLAPHVNCLYKQIRIRALVQYFASYDTADLVKMADAFNCSVVDLENELVHLILDDQIKGRIDSKNKVLHAREEDPRTETYNKVINIGKDYQRRTNMLVLRTAMHKANIYVKGNHRILGTDIAVAGNATSTGPRK